MTYKTEDTNLNDFLFCTEKFGVRPSKVVLAFNFKPAEFIKFFEDKAHVINVLTEVVPAEGTSVINEKYFVAIGDDDNTLYVSYTHFDKSVDTGYISGVILYYNLNKNKHLEEIMAELDSFILENKMDISKINMIVNTTSGLILEELEPMDADYDNINCYFNDSTIKKTNKLVKKISKTNKGLSVIYGKRGTGKTTLLNHIASICSKTCIFIPITMIDATINNPEFISVLREYNPLIIIDDCEILFDTIYVKSNMAYANILQMIDGFYSDDIDTHVLLSFNTDSEDDINDELLESNNLLKVIHVKALNVAKGNELCKFLGMTHVIENDTILVDVLNEDFQEDVVHVGYN